MCNKTATKKKYKFYKNKNMLIEKVNPYASREKGIVKRIMNTLDMFYQKVLHLIF